MPTERIFHTGINMGCMNTVYIFSLLFPCLTVIMNIYVLMIFNGKSCIEDSFLYIFLAATC